MKPRFVMRRRGGKLLNLCLFLMLATILFSACGGNSQLQQKAGQNKQDLDSSLIHAQTIGVPANLLAPIIQQKQQLENTHAPLGLFGDAIVNDYYTNLALRYSQLNSQVEGMEIQLTEQYDYQASQDLQTLSTILSQRQDQNYTETKTFASQLTNYQQDLGKAKYPKDYLLISSNAKNSTEALRLMGPAHDALTNFQTVINQLQKSHIDVTLFKKEYQSDQQSLSKASTSADFEQLITLIKSQMDQTTTVSTVAIPYVGKVKLNQFKEDIKLIKQYGEEDVSKYEQRLQIDQQALDEAKTVKDFLKVSAQIDADVASIQLPLIRAQADDLLQQFHNEVKTWGQSHQYHDTFNGQYYPLDYEYDAQGVGSDADYVVQIAVTKGDYQSAIDQIKNDMLHLQMMEQSYNNKTPYNKPHTEDFTLMNHYGIANADEVLVVSLIEQSLRYYQNGKLVRSFLITTGQYDKPSPPGYWQIFDRESPTTFKSSEPKGSAFYYPDTKINFAMEYHAGGYFFHDSWWRLDYGPGTNFPHYDSGGDESFAGSGSHGCFNMSEDEIAWLYPNTHYNARVLVY
ncbi:MAG TPA: L,D-transpeptidase [Ktedonobacteraceae bacterium]|nr:L,D-transpeptidase [Ktedonobacteraceae bacterium]